jgi:hypothetical protein
MLTAAKFDKTLILMINSASVGLALGVVLVTVYAVIDLPALSNDYWGFGTLAQQMLDHYTPSRF